MDPALVRVVLRYVERNLGREAADAVVRAVGLGHLDDLTAEGSRWYSRLELLALADEAARVCNDVDFGRRVGEELVRANVASGMVEALRSAGSVEAALPGFLNAGSKMAITRRMGLLEAGPGNALIEAAFSSADEAHPFFCGVVSGFYSAMPSIFGFCGSAVEIACQTRGDDACRFRLAWDGEPHGESSAKVRTIVGSDSVGQVDPLLRRFEQLQDMASALATAEDVTTALQLVAELSSQVVSAPRHLLAVRTTTEGELRVFSKGWEHDPDDAIAVARRLDRGVWGANEVVVRVESEHGAYGVLAAIYSADAAAGEVERRLLASYAKHAAAAIEAAASLETARRDRDTAASLLSLAHALSEASSHAQVVSTLTDLLPAVLSCEHVWLWTWNAEAARLELASTSFELQPGMPTSLEESEVPGIRRLIDEPRPMFLDAGLERAPINLHLAATETVWGAVVPIQARGDFLGVIVAAYPERLEARAELDLVARMRGLAGQAAAALDNARLLDRIRDQALRDPLTGLPNRPLMEDRAHQALASCARTGDHVGLLFVDLDRFKIVNDTLGHAAGDRLICRVADRIGESLRTSDTLARLGGDEFVVLLPRIAGVDDAAAAATRIVESLREPFDFDNRKLFVSCSIGVAVSGVHGATYADLLQHADAAMYEAKAQGKNTFEVRATRAIPSGRAGGRDQLDLEADLHLAAERDELTLLYQPQIDFRTMRIVAVEALLRWDHHELGRLGPDAFLPMAEESGLIVELDRWVRETAVAQAVRWVNAGTPLRVAVNISTRDLHRPTLGSEISDLLSRAGLWPSLLELEITDRVVMSEERLPTLLAELKTIGVRLAIDDFGTGTSVLGRLQRCPVDVLKIDKGFVQTITAANPDAPVVAALMSLAHQLGLEVVAEGVETAFQGGLLRRMGGHLAQGYFFSPPVDADAIDALVASPFGEDHSMVRARALPAAVRVPS
jgi:diguanylate cyclase (GGDEF)-like protein